MQLAPPSAPSLAATALAVLLLAGCSGSDDRAGETATAVPATAPTPAPAPPASPPPPAEGATTGGDGSAIVLSTLSAAEIGQAALPGELGCSFAAAGAAGPLLVAMGDVGSREPAWGVVKVGTYVERVAAPGGFDAMLKGATFSGAGKTVRIALTGPAVGGGESPPRPATLTYDRADGARRVFAGLWTCGP